MSENIKGLYMHGNKHTHAFPFLLLRCWNELLLTVKPSIYGAILYFSFVPSRVEVEYTSWAFSSFSKDAAKWLGLQHFK